MSTTLKVSTATRDAVKHLAEADGLTIDAEVALLARRERQRRMGDALAAWEPDNDEAAWLDLAVEATQ